MKFLKSFELFEAYFLSKKDLESRVKEIGLIDKDVQIRFDVRAVGHALQRQARHGSVEIGKGKVEMAITEQEIIDTIERAIEQITISAIQNVWDFYKNGKPNRFVIRRKDNDLHIVCSLEPDVNNFNLMVITVMKEKDFNIGDGQYVVTVGPGNLVSWQLWNK